jgi:hypothetical protein
MKKQLVFSFTETASIARDSHHELHVCPLFKYASLNAVPLSGCGLLGEQLQSLK